MPCVCSPCPSAGTDTPAVAPAPPFPSSSRVPLPGAAEQSRKSPAAGPPAGLSFAAVKLTHSCAVPFLGVILFIFFIVVVIVIVFLFFSTLKTEQKCVFFFSNLIESLGCSTQWSQLPSSSLATGVLSKICVPFSS